jgi:hypothetical protein
MGSSSVRSWRKSVWKLLMAIAAVSFVGACRPTTEPVPTVTEQTTEQPAVQSPLPTESAAFESPLAPDSPASQSPLAPPASEEVLFAIDKPLLAGSRSTSWMLRWRERCSAAA